MSSRMLMCLAPHALWPCALSCGLWTFSGQIFYPKEEDLFTSFTSVHGFFISGIGCKSQAKAAPTPSLP